MYGCSPDDEVKVKKPFPPKRVAPRSKEERCDNWEEMIHDALIHTKLSNSVLRRDDDEGDDDDDALIDTKLSNSILSSTRFQN